jgi:hypothetical protein
MEIQESPHGDTEHINLTCYSGPPRWGLLPQVTIFTHFECLLQRHSQHPQRHLESVLRCFCLLIGSNILERGACGFFHLRQAAMCLLPSGNFTQETKAECISIYSACSADISLQHSTLCTLQEHQIIISHPRPSSERTHSSSPSSLNGRLRLRPSILTRAFHFS